VSDAPVDGCASQPVVSACSRPAASSRREGSGLELARPSRPAISPVHRRCSRYGSASALARPLRDGALGCPRGDPTRRSGPPSRPAGLLATFADTSWLGRPTSALAVGSRVRPGSSVSGPGWASAATSPRAALLAVALATVFDASADGCASRLVVSARSRPAGPALAARGSVSSSLGPPALPPIPCTDSARVVARHRLSPAYCAMGR